MNKENSDSKKSWFQKNWSNMLFVVFAVLFLIPSTRFHLQVAINRVFSFAPSIEEETELKQLINYNWRLIDSNELSQNFSSSKGKVVFINFWASWCGPCVAEMPSLQKLYTNHKNEVDFYFIARDEQPAIQEFMAKENLDLPVYYELQNPPKILQSNQLPTTYLIDKQGQIWIEKTGAADWNSERVNKLINELVAE